MAFLYPLFFISGVPALLYQVVWQRALFTIYGTNTESATAVVAAFLLGLGLGAFAGGWAASRWPTRLLIIYGVIEFVIGLFGLVSLQIFRLGRSTLHNSQHGANRHCRLRAGGAANAAHGRDTADPCRFPGRPTRPRRRQCRASSILSTRWDLRSPVSSRRSSSWKLWGSAGRLLSPPS